MKDIKLKVRLKDGLLTVGLTKPQAKTLADAQDICQVIRSLKPVDDAITTGAGQACDGLTALLALCAKIEEPRPLLEAAEKAEVKE